MFRRNTSKYFQKRKREKDFSFSQFNLLRLDGVRLADTLTLDLDIGLVHLALGKELSEQGHSLSGRVDALNAGGEGGVGQDRLSLLGQPSEQGGLDRLVGLGGLTGRILALFVAGVQCGQLGLGMVDDGFGHLAVDDSGQKITVGHIGLGFVHGNSFLRFALGVGHHPFYGGVPVPLTIISITEFLEKSIVIWEIF